MQKKFIKIAAIIISVAMAVAFLVVFAFQNLTAYGNAREKLDSLLDRVEQSMVDNEEQIAQLIISTGEDYLARTHAFSFMIAQDPSILESEATLNQIMTMLDVDELHVTDEKGIIRWGTVPGYFGFDMSTSEQTIPFMALLKDKNAELAQEPQPNGTLGILFQYIGVARQDQSGIVQIGMQPTRLEEALENTEIGIVLNPYVQKDEGVFALNVSDGTVAWHMNAALIGLTAEEAGMKDSIQTICNDYNAHVINGERVYVTGRAVGDYVIVSYLTHASARLLPHTEGAVLDSGRNVLGGTAEICKLEIVDAASTISRKMRDISRLHHRDQIGRKTAFDHVRAHGENNLRAVLLCFLYALNQFVKIRISPCRNLIFTGALQIINTHQIDTFIRVIGFYTRIIQGHASAIHTVFSFSFCL